MRRRALLAALVTVVVGAAVLLVSNAAARTSGGTVTLAAAATEGAAVGPIQPIPTLPPSNPEELAEPEPAAPSADEPEAGKPSADEPAAEAIADRDDLGPILALASVAAHPEGGISYGYAIDHERLYEVAGLDPAMLCDDHDAWATAFKALILDYGISGPYFFRHKTDDVLTDMDRSFGFTPCDITATLELGLPNNLVRAAVPAENLIEAAQADERHADRLVVIEEAELTILEWPNEPVAALETSPMFPDTFSSPSIATTGDTIVRSAATAGIRSALDPERQRVSDINNLRTPLEVLEAAGAYAIVLSDTPYVARSMPDLGELLQSERTSDEVMDELIDSATSQPQGLVPWSVLMIGATGTATEPEAVVVFGHLNGDDAALNGERLGLMMDLLPPQGSESSWSDAIEIAEIQTVDRFLVARLSPKTPDAHPFRMLVGEYIRLGPLLGIGNEPAE